MNNSTKNRIERIVELTAKIEDQLQHFARGDQMSKLYEKTDPGVGEIIKRAKYRSNDYGNPKGWEHTPFVEGWGVRNSPGAKYEAKRLKAQYAPVRAAAKARRAASAAATAAKTLKRKKLMKTGLIGLGITAAGTAAYRATRPNDTK